MRKRKIPLFLVLIICIVYSCNNKSHKERREEMLQKETKGTTNDEANNEEINSSKEINNPNYEQGIEFLSENGKRKEVTTTASGLQYEVIAMGAGAKPSASDKVRVHYAGTLIDGREFDSSYKRGEPITFPLNGVIRGWTEGLQLMPIGSKFKFYIPYDLAYGEQGAGDLIVPYSTLIFTVELLGIEETAFNSDAALNLLANKLNDPKLTFYAFEDTKINGEDAFYFSAMTNENGKSTLIGMYCVTKVKKEIYQMHLTGSGYDKI